jgi:outer membrane receptor protein involved in Fe transport
MGKYYSAALAVSLPATILACVLGAPTSLAQDAAPQRYHLPAQALDASLRAVALASGRSIVAPADVLAGRSAPALDGRYTPEAAIAALLAGTSLHQRSIDGDVVISGETPAVQSGGVAVGNDGSIIVTGSRIRGAPIASPVIHLDREDITRSGQSSLTDVVRSLPQGFGGGMNVGVGQNAGSDNGDYGGASTFNLRGIGTDATLTLLNGHRLSYNGARQGVDVSVIPLGAVERLEILPDGASALYGSDAVAGVANIILRRDFDGLKVEADGGFATRGAYSRQRYGATAGKVWQSGGIIASYEYARSSALLSDERSFSRGRPGVTIYPELARHALVLSGHQALTDSLSFAADLLFNRRVTPVVSAGNPAGDLALSHNLQTSTVRSYAIAPSLTLTLPGSWQMVLSGVYGNDRLKSRSEIYVGQEMLGAFDLCYCNSGKSVELAADGDLFALPGGEARAALGVGYRNNVLNALRGVGNPSNVHASQDSYYGYGELSLPIVSPGLEISGIHRLNLSAALRYERYPRVDGVATPKFGLIYAPLADLDIKASWGRAFRAPSLLQQYGQPVAALYPAQSLGGSGYAADATSLLVYGGNLDLKPERARTWTASLDIHPSALKGARLQLSYFNTHYVNRIVDPMPFVSNALSDPQYADLVALNPVLATTVATIASAAQFFNDTGMPTNLANVVAIVDDRYRNAGRQAIHGVDILADYQVPLAGGRLAATLNASYLHFNQQLTADQPVIPRSGLLFTPPHWRGRASLSWMKGGTSLDGTISRIGGVDDMRTAQTVRVGGMTTLDLTAHYRFENAVGALRNVELSVSLMNAFDATPAQIASTSFYDSTFDSTNYSALGRIMNLGISKTW